ncbi:hypothetical protein SteCoe_23757 [Stentor coeruleus]|uniref:Globin n=1 Tax=Stentor coeruleus TaxID=5963 RepID=A0A1R2BJK0_9CILI|nr:hypothetical protein SteCoe_23757 [Stentor coeruleus]
MSQSMFERVGGTPALQELFTRFYAKVLADPIAAPYFKGFDMNDIKGLQIEFWSNFLGSGVPYTGRDMYESHKTLGCSGASFDVVANSLASTLKELNVPEDIYEAIMNHAASFRKDIVAPTMFERVGGTAALTELFTRFYAKVLTNPAASPFFNGFDMAQIKNLQIEFWSNFLGSGTAYTGRNMLDSHKGLNCTEASFDVVATALSDTLKELNVPEDIYNHIMTHAASFRGDIVGQ